MTLAVDRAVKPQLNQNLLVLSRLLFTRVSQELVRQILRGMKYNYDLLFVLRFYGPVNSYGHVEPISHSITLLLGRIRHTKRLIST